VVEVDFRDFFWSLEPGLLLGLVARRISDRRVLRLIRQWMRAGVMEDGVTISSATGVPQGGSISPLLSNVYGHALWAKEMNHVGTIVRFADDALILCRSEADAQRAFRWLQSTARGLKLSLHPDKTRIVNLSDGSGGVDFLGFHLRWVRSLRYKRWLLPEVAIWPRYGEHQGQGQTDHGSARSTEAAHRCPGGRAEPGAAGIGQLFPMGNSSRKFSQIDSYVQERLALFDSKKRQRSGPRWGDVHAFAWFSRLGVHRLSGTVRYA